MKRALLVMVLIAGMGLIFWSPQSQPAEAGRGWVENELPPRPTPPAVSPTPLPTSPPAPTATPQPDNTPTSPPIATVTPPPGSTPTTPPIATSTPPPGSTPTATPPGSPGGGGKSRGGSGGGSVSDTLITGLNTSYQTQPGVVIELVATVKNGGRGVAKDVQATSTLPPFLELVGVTSSWGTVHTTNQTFHVDIGQLMPNDEVRMHVQTRVVSHTIPPYNKYAMTVSSQNDANPDNNIARFIIWTFNQ